MTTVSERIRWTSLDRSHVRIEGLVDGEADIFEAFLLGASWIRVTEDGRLESRPRFIDPPPPERDKQLHPMWTPEGELRGRDYRSMEFDPEKDVWSASLLIRSLAPYGGSYSASARTLESSGFECAPKAKIYHKAAKLGPNGAVSAVCYATPRPIPMKTQTWTLRWEAVTCRKCLAKRPKEN